MEKEVRVYQSDTRVSDESREINGMAAVFNRDSQKLGWFYERIDPKAFDNCDMSDVIACRNHDPDKVLARTSAETLKLVVDENGVGYRFDAPNTSVGNDTLEDIRVGNISKSSFAFTVKSDKWEKLGNGDELRTILEVDKLYDVSPVTNPAYPDTSVQLNAAKRSYEEWKKDDETDDPNDDMAMTWRDAKTKLLSLQ